MPSARVAHACFAVWLLCSIDARAQNAEREAPAGEVQAGEAPAEAEPARVPPAVEHLPELVLPPGVEVPDDALEAIVRVDEEGRAVLEQSTAQGMLRERIEAIVREARFVPARVGDEPRAARVRLRFRVVYARAPVAADASRVEQSGDADAAPPPEEPLPGFGAHARVQVPRVTARKLELDEMREVPGTFGDPFRILDTLPGVLPVFSGVPYVYVRGAPPAGTVYVYDGIAVPTLFHLALGPAVIHPAMIGDLEFYSAVPPARYGRRTGGVFAAEGPELSLDAPLHGEAELRLVDTHAMINVPIDEGRVILAGRYGYPGLLLSLFSPEAVLAYWDYQARVRKRLSGPDWFEFTWFGSYDHAGEKDDDNDGVTLEFHRAEVRLIRELDGHQIGFALQGGFERSALGDEVSVHALRFGPRLWWAAELGGGARARLGADMLGTVGEIVLHDGESGGASDPVPAQALPPERAVPGTDSTAPPGASPPSRFEQAVPREGDEVDEDQRFFDDPVYGAVAARNQAALYAELVLPLAAGLSIEPGARVDAWLSGSRRQSAFEPRLVASYQPSPPLTFHVGAGLGHQLAALPIPLPAFSDVALEHGLQSSLQTEVGAALEASETLQLELELFYNHLWDLVLAELFLECTDDSEGALCPEDGLVRGDVDAYGAEIFVRRDVSETLSGWISYTLAWAHGQTAVRAVVPSNLSRDSELRVAASDGSFTPEFDVRHIANLVLQWRVIGGFRIGARVHFRTGKVASESLTYNGIYLRLERRLPGFFRADAQLAYGWDTSWGRMRVALEWMNVTLSREATGLSCEGDEEGPGCEVDYAPAIFFPNLGVRGEF